MGPGVLFVVAGLFVVVLVRRAPLFVTLLACAAGGLHAHGVIDVPEPAAIARAQQRIEAVQDRSVVRLSCRSAAIRATAADDPLITRHC